MFFFVGSIGFWVFTKSEKASNISLLSGAIIEVVSAINFYLYNRASKQLADFHSSLDATQRFLVANSVCEQLEDQAKQQSRSDLVRLISESAITRSDINS